MYGGQFSDRHSTGNLKVVTQTWSETEKLEYYCSLSFQSKLLLVTISASVCVLAGLILCYVVIGIIEMVFFTAQAVWIMFKTINPSQFIDFHSPSQSLPSVEF